VVDRGLVWLALQECLASRLQPSCMGLRRWLDGTLLVCAVAVTRYRFAATILRYRLPEFGARHGALCIPTYTIQTPAYFLYLCLTSEFDHQSHLGPSTSSFQLPQTQDWVYPMRHLAVQSVNNRAHPRWSQTP